MLNTNQIKQLLLVVGCLGIEIFIFSNQYKYSVLYEYESFIIDNFLSIKLIVIFFGGIANYLMWVKLKSKSHTPLFIVYLLKGFQSKGNSLVGLINIIYTLIHIAWIGDELFNSDFLNAFIRFNFLIFLPLVYLVFINKRFEQEEIYEPRVLIASLSILNEDKIKNAQNVIRDEQLKIEFTKVIRESVVPPNDNYWAWDNFDPIRKSLILHQKSIETVVLLVSNTVYASLKKFNEQNLRPDVIIKKFMVENLNLTNANVYLSANLDNEYINNSQQIYSNTLLEKTCDANDLTDTSNEIKRILDVLLKKYQNKDILFNITNATAVSSCAMIINAIPFERMAEYVHQEKGVVNKVELNIFEIKDLMDELIEKVS